MNTEVIKLKIRHPLEYAKKRERQGRLAITNLGVEEDLPKNTPRFQ